jgi:excisionase family DNA binding protein
MSELIGYRKVATKLGVPIGTVYSMVAHRRIPHVRLGKRLVRFREEDVDAYIAAKRVAAVEPQNGGSHD